MKNIRCTWGIIYNAVLFFISTAETHSQLTVVDPVEVYNASGVVDQDDMCIWLHPTNKSLSTIIASDKISHQIFVYDLQGNVLQTIDVTGQEPGNIDIRYNIPIGGVLTDIVGFNRRTGSAIVIYTVDRNTRLLTFAGNFPSAANYGFSFYKSKVTGKYYAFISSLTSAINQYEIHDNNNDGVLASTFIRTLTNGSGQTEGMAGDDETGILYATNEDAGVYKFDAEPGGSTTRTLVAAVGTNGLTADVEGISIYYAAGGQGYLLVSSQGSDNVKIYNRQSPHTFVKTVQVTGVGSSDGIDVLNVSLGPDFPGGIYLTHDGTGVPFVVRGCRWEDFELTVDTSYWNPRHSPFSFTTNTFAVIGDFGSEGINAQRVANLVKSWNPEFVITTGDNNYGTNPIDENIGQYYSRFIYPYGGSYPPSSPDQNRLWLSVGNHDYDDGGGITAMKNFFPHLVPNTYYDKVIGNVHFFFLDSEEYYQYSGPQKTWFDNAVAGSTSLWRIALFHHPPYTSGGGGHPANEHNMRAWPIAANNFHIAFIGHVHNMEHMTVSGQSTHYVVQGAGGRSLYTFANSNPSPAVRVWGLDSKYGACKVIVSPTNIITEFWSTNGTTNILEHSFSLDNPLPVELVSFTGKIKNDFVLLEWETASEVNNYGFDIEKKNNGVWTKIGFVSGNGNSNSPKFYEFMDNNILQKNIYRLKQIDTDGQFEYSASIEVEFISNLKFELIQNYPNPFNPVTTIKFSIPQAGNVTLLLYNILGEQVAELLTGFREAGIHTINFDASELKSGIYFYQLESGGFIQSKKMILLK